MSPVDGKSYTACSNIEAKWYDMIFDATNTKEGRLMVGYDIIPIEHRDKV